MKAVKCLVLLIALACCVESRQRLGKIFKRQARQREYKAFQTPQAGIIAQSVVRKSFAQPQSQLAARPGQVSQINVPLISQASRQNLQGQQLSQPPYPAQQGPQTQYQQAPQQTAQPSYPAQQGPQTQYHQAPQQTAQPSYPAQQSPQTQYHQAPQQTAQPSYPAQQGPQIQFQQQNTQAQFQQAPQQAAQPSYPNNQQVPIAYPSTPPMAQLIAVRDDSNMGPWTLPSNASLIRRSITYGFSCEGRRYGYYADVENDCQIFHICYPMKDVFNNDPSVPDNTYQYSFICNEFTRFSQESMTCVWTYEMESCALSEMMYPMNDRFFKIPTPAPIITPAYVPGPIDNSNLLPYLPIRN